MSDNIKDFIKLLSIQNTTTIDEETIYRSFIHLYRIVVFQ